MNLRETILAKNDLHQESIHVPEWDTDVIVKTMTAGQRSDMLDKCIDKNKKNPELDSKKLYIYTVIYCAYDPTTDKPIFTEADYDALRGKSSNALEIILTAANRINALGEDEVKKLEKN